MATINKAELIKEVAESTDLNKTQSDQAIDAVFSAIQNALAKDEKVQLIGFGSFEVRNRAARKAVTHKLVRKLIFLQLRFLHLSQVKA